MFFKTQLIIFQCNTSVSFVYLFIFQYFANVKTFLVSMFIFGFFLLIFNVLNIFYRKLKIFFGSIKKECSFAAYSKEIQE